jgi:antitoxin PrlF
MSTISTLTSKGKITIPSKIRSHLRIENGDEIEFMIDADGRVFVTPHTSDVTQLKNLLPKPKRKVSIEEMKRAVAKRRGKNDDN